MSAPREYRLPPIRAVLALVGVFAVLSHFSAVHHSEAYSNRISSLRSYLGLGSDGMPLSARVRLGHAAAGAGAVADDGGHSLAFESSVSRTPADLGPLCRPHELTMTSPYPRWPDRLTCSSSTRPWTSEPTPLSSSSRATRTCGTSSRASAAWKVGASDCSLRCASGAHSSSSSGTNSLQIASTGGITTLTSS
jgi:hypothetical protein